MRPDKEKREQILQLIDRGQIDLVDAVRQLRRTTGLSQKAYARKIKVSVRHYIAFEQRKGNPTLNTIQKILAPFGLELAARRRSTLNYEN